VGFRVKLLTRTTTGWFPSGLSRSPRRGALQELLRKAELNGDVDCLREGVRVLALRSWKSRWRSTSVLNATSYALCKIQERMLRIKDSMEIEDAAGQRVALITPVRAARRRSWPSLRPSMSCSPATRWPHRSDQYGDAEMWQTILSGEPEHDRTESRCACGWQDAPDPRSPMSGLGVDQPEVPVLAEVIEAGRIRVLKRLLRFRIELLRGQAFARTRRLHCT